MKEISPHPPTLSPLAERGRPVRIGVIGAGKFGTVHLNTFRQLGYDGVAELAAAAETDAARAEEVWRDYGCAVFQDYREMIAKVEMDGVTVVTPDFLHREMVLAAAKAGLHVLVEKPMDVTVQGCDAMIAAAKAAGILLQVDFHKRYDPEHRNLAQRVGRGDLGEILYGYVHMEDRIEIPTEWFPHWAPKSSPVWFLGTHFFDLIRWVTKLEAKRVYATGNKKRLLNDFGVDTFDNISAKVEYENGASICYDVSWIIPKSFEAVVNQALRLVGTKGMWEVDTQDRGSRSCTEGEGMRTHNSSFMSEQADKLGRTVFRGYGTESIADFAYNIKFLKEGGSLEQLSGKYPSGEDGREVTRLAVAIHKSIETGKVVRVQS